MSQKIQSSFSAGELDPALHERTTFDKYKTGLATLRNAHIGKTGRIVSRAGIKYLKSAKTPTVAAQTFTCDGISNALIAANHGMRDGDTITLSTTGTLPGSGSLVAGDIYYVLFSHGVYGTFGVASSYANYLARTVVNIPGTGSGTHTFTPTEVNKECILYSPPYTEYLIEWGHGYVRVHDLDLGTYEESVHSMSELDLPYVQFVPHKGYVNVFCKNRKAMKIVLGTLDSGDFFRTTRIEEVLNSLPVLAVPSETSRVIGGTGYNVQYASAIVLKGEEFTVFEHAVGSAKLPINPAEKNTFVVNCSSFTGATELRVYRRPENGIAYGYMATVAISAGAATFEDYGEDVDYTQQPVVPVDKSLSQPVTSSDIDGRTGAIYQQRLLVTDNIFKGELFASRTGYLNNFYRDIPYRDDSALLFKVGSGGYGEILHLIDNGGLLAFTTTGVYQNIGAMAPTNLAFDKKGSWVAQETLVPLEVPGGLLFVDRVTNTVRNLIYSNEAGGYAGAEMSVFSDHLFRGRQIVSWAFQDGDIPLVHCVFDDGEAASFTYDREHEMRAWARSDTDGLYESVTVNRNFDGQSVVYFLVNRDGTRLIEYGTDRFVTDIKEMVCMDSAVSYNSELSAGATLNVTADDPMDWEGTLTLTSDIAIFSNSASLGAVGSIFRFFDSEGAAIDLEVTTYTSTTVVKVTPSTTFPSAEADEITIYRTYTTLTGLSHLEGKLVSLLSDGYVEASPNNDIEDYGDLVVSGGQVTIPGGRRGAFVHVGLPFTADVETLDIDTVEQSPALLESKIVEKVNVKVFNTRGLYVGSEFPENDYIQGMEDLETMTEDIELGNVGNAAQPLQTKRIEVSVPNDWDSNGRLCFRQVDPLPFEILSIIPELNILR